MPDHLTSEQRFRAMSRVPQKNTSAEVKLARALHRRGMRYRKHVKGLPGTPDIVFTRAKVAVFVDGDFWHGYAFRKWDGKLKPFWRDKIQTNRQRDIRNFCQLRRMGWTVVRVWEHDIKRRLEETVERVYCVWQDRTSTKP